MLWRVFRYILALCSRAKNNKPIRLNLFWSLTFCKSSDRVYCPKYPRTRDFTQESGNSYVTHFSLMLHFIWKPVIWFAQQIMWLVFIRYEILWAEGLRADYRHSLKSVCIRNFSGQYFPAFGLSLLIQSECGKIQTRKIQNTGNFHAVRNMQSTADKLIAVFSLYFQTKQNVICLSIC